MLRKSVLLFVIEFRIIYKGKYAENCIFNGPVIPFDSLLCLASCLTSNGFTQLHLIWILSSVGLEKSEFFPKMRHLLLWVALYSLAF